jgi:hypothetical protein
MCDQLVQAVTGTGPERHPDWRLHRPEPVQLAELQEYLRRWLPAWTPMRQGRSRASTPARRPGVRARPVGPVVVAGRSDWPRTPSRHEGGAGACWSDGTVSTPETTVLPSMLRAQRAHVLGTLTGLPDEALRRPVRPSGWTRLGLVCHLALDVERFWFAPSYPSSPGSRWTACGQRGLAGRRGRAGRRRPGPLPRRVRARRRGHCRPSAGRRAGLGAGRPVRGPAATRTVPDRAARGHRDGGPRRPPGRGP